MSASSPSPAPRNATTCPGAPPNAGSAATGNTARPAWTTGRHALATAQAAPFGPPSARSHICGGNSVSARSRSGAGGMPTSTVHAVLTRCRLNRLSHIDRVTGEPAAATSTIGPGRCCTWTSPSTATSPMAAAGALPAGSRAAATGRPPPPAPGPGPAGQPTSRRSVPRSCTPSGTTPATRPTSANPPPAPRPTPAPGKPVTSYINC